MDQEELRMDRLSRLPTREDLERQAKRDAASDPEPNDDNEGGDNGDND